MIPKCKNCLLYDKKNDVCRVAVVVEGEQYELPVRAEDECHWVRLDLEVSRDLKAAIKRSPAKEIKQKLTEELDTPVAVKEFKFWSDGKNGYAQERG